LNERRDVDGRANVDTAEHAHERRETSARPRGVALDAFDFEHRRDAPRALESLATNPIPPRADAAQEPRREPLELVVLVLDEEDRGERLAEAAIVSHVDDGRLLGDRPAARGMRGVSHETHPMAFPLPLRASRAGQGNVLGVSTGRAEERREFAAPADTDRIETAERIENLSGARLESDEHDRDRDGDDSDPTHAPPPRASLVHRTPAALCATTWYATTWCATTLYATTLCATTLCATTLCATTLCATTLCATKGTP
jgi:hypothetical protein